MDHNQLTFRLEPEMKERLEARDGFNTKEKSPHLIAKRDLERYYDLLHRYLQEVNLTEREAIILVNACEDVVFRPPMYHLLWGAVQDYVTFAPPSFRGEGWELEVQRLVERLQHLTPGQLYALVDAIERYRLSPGEGALAKVGLVR